MNRPLIYIASPYTKGVKSKNAAFNIELWTYFTEHCPGYDFYPALWPAHVQHLSEGLGRGEFPAMPEQYWINYDLRLLDKCQGIILANGWDDQKWTESDGCNGEFKAASESNIMMYCQALEPECKFIAEVARQLNNKPLNHSQLSDYHTKDNETPVTDVDLTAHQLFLSKNPMPDVVEPKTDRSVYIVDCGSRDGISIEVFSTYEKAFEYAGIHAHPSDDEDDIKNKICDYKVDPGFESIIDFEFTCIPIVRCSFSEFHVLIGNLLYKDTIDQKIYDKFIIFARKMYLALVNGDQCILSTFDGVNFKFIRLKDDYIKITGVTNS